MNSINEIRSFFSKDGQLAKHTDNYRVRDGQITMSTLVHQCITQKQKIVIEAGTGIGKTYAYLLPAILCGKKIIISTASRNLQDQLFYKDLPALLNVLKVSPTIALLKGKSNYLCKLTLIEQLNSTQYPHLWDDLLKIYQWMGITSDGDFSSLQSISSFSQAIALVSYSQDSCINHACEFYNDCFIKKAQIKAEKAQITIINHHLFFSHYNETKKDQDDNLLNADVVIFDEAHHLPNIARNYLGQLFSTKKLHHLLQSLKNLYFTELMDVTKLDERIEVVFSNLHAFHYDSLNINTTDWFDLLSSSESSSIIYALQSSINELINVLSLLQDRNKELDILTIELAKEQEKFSLFVDANDETNAYQLHRNQEFINLKMMPLLLAPYCNAIFTNDTAWIFTSATLQINDDFGQFINEMGLKESTQHIIKNPFNYQQQSVFCVPMELDKANVIGDKDWLNIFLTICIKTINNAGGRTLILFTSHHMLQTVAQLLKQQICYPILVQGTLQKRQLLTKFSQLGNAVLLGSYSFWEGIDIKGPSLSCVIIDKLPFISPDEALYKTQAKYLIKQNRDPFYEISLPQAIMLMKQGIGRLIRSEHDKGVFILGDNRIINRHYSDLFMKSLPAMSKTRNFEKTLAYLAKL